jgi:hypothetical protein
LPALATAQLSPGLLAVTGQSATDAWSIADAVKKVGWARYEFFLANEPRLVFQRIRDLVQEFPTWQRRAATGRPSYDERDILLALLVRQYKEETFRGTEAFLRQCPDVLGLKRIPDATTLSRKNATPRFRQLMERLHFFILNTLPKRKAIVATDATGFGRRKRSWRETPFAYRAARKSGYIKANCAVEVPQRIILSPTITTARRYESVLFKKTWSKIPSNVTPTRSLADAAYSGNPCLEVVKAHGASAIHSIPKNAKYVDKPVTERDNLVHFARHWPKRYVKLKAMRALVETTFANIKELFGDRLSCRTDAGAANELLARCIAHNSRIIAQRALLCGEGPAVHAGA